MPSHPDTSFYICITVCTRERPIMLRQLIDSYKCLIIPAGVHISLEVVENDTQCKVHDLVVDANSATHPLHHHQESRLGIPFARNKCVEIAKSKNATHIAFVDDDEWFSPDWLLQIWQFWLNQNPTSVIQGDVISTLPAQTPTYFKDFFQRKAPPTGTALTMCRTNNVLVPMSVFYTHALAFDESHPFAGGTDSKLFRKAHALGIPLIFCAEATVFEEIPSARVTYKWLSIRNFRIGLTMGEHIQFQNYSQKVIHLFGRLFSAGKYLFKSIVYLVIGNRPKHWRSWLKACKKLGEGLGPFGVKVDSYRNIQGH